MEEIVVIFLCLVLNGLFSCFEMAFVTVGKPQLRQMTRSASLSAKAALRILARRENPERTLSVIQIGITLVGMVSAAVGGAGAQEKITPMLRSYFRLSETTGEIIAIVLVVLPLAFFSVVLGELVPKTIALRDPLRISLFGAPWINLIDRLFSPLVSLLERATKFVLLFIPKKKLNKGSEQTGSVEIDHLSAQTQQYVLNLVSVETRRVRDVMVPWNQVNSIQESDTLEQVTLTVVRSGHTRLPVMRDQTVIGLLHAKEFITMLASRGEEWRSIVRPVIAVTENELALRALRLMQSRSSHLSIVVSKDRVPVGIVTMEDVIEEVVGDIFDEDDDGRVKQLLSNSPKRRATPPIK